MMIGPKERASRSLVLTLIGVITAACGSSSASGAGSTSGGPSASPTASATTPTSPSTVPPSPTDPAASFDPTGVELSIDVIVDGLASPVDVAAPGDGSGRLFVVEQAGRIRVVSDGELLTQPLLDIQARISRGGERGLLGLAFHPDFPTDPRLFVDYTDLKGDTVVAEFRLDAQNEDVADPDSERILIQIDQPYANHNGGGVVFGPDGMLYIATGDGGSGGDPHGNGQRLDSLLGKILRIDVDGSSGGTDGAYGIPDDNPFVDVADAEPEIWLTGLRNPWRIRFDRETGDLWIGDVGQGEWEEIDVAPAGTGGLNFGWNRMEGLDCFEPREGCDQTGLTPPLAQYGHDLGCAVIGGVVVRDADQPLLNGGYLFSDSCSGNFWLLDAADSGRDPVLFRGAGRSISSITLDDDGTVLATDLGTGELVRISAVAR